MKRLKLLVSLLIIPFLMIPMVVNASDAKIKITSSETTLKTGNIIIVTVNLTSNTPIGYYEYTLDYNTKNLKLLNSNSYIVNSPNDSTTTKVSKDFKFKVLKDYNTNISVKSYTVTSFKGEKNLSVSVKPLELKGSSDNPSKNKVYLKSLSVEGATLKPEFNKNTTDYTLTLNSNVDKIKISATPSDSDYDVEGTGEFEITKSDNKFEVTVSDDDNNSKTYTLKISEEKTKKITVTVDGEEYILITDANSYENIPKGFEEKTITIDKQKIKALYNDNTEQTLVVLKDADGKLGLFLYDEKEKSYSKYEVITSEKVSIIPVKTNEVLKGYKKDKTSINDTNVNCLRLTDDSIFVLIYGMDAENGTKDWYSYDISNKTLQKYNSEIDDYYTEKDKNTRILIYILAGTSILFGILVIILAIKLSRRK